MGKIKEEKRGDIILYKAAKGPQIEVRIQGETVWLSQKQIGVIFSKSADNIGLHLKNIFKAKELDEKAVAEEFSVTATDGKTYIVKHYSLDAVISVGYRVNSKTATQFRIWATRTLKEFLVKGYALNEKRLQETQQRFAELQTTIAFLKEKSEKNLLAGQGKEILDLLASYAKTLTILDEYDKGNLREARGSKGKYVLAYEDCTRIIVELKRLR